MITRNSNSPNILENLIINVQANQQPKAYLLKFESTNPITTSFNPTTFTGTKMLTSIVYNPSQAKEMAETGFVCEIVELWFCPNHTSWQEGCTGHGSSYEMCRLSNGGSSSSTQTGNSNGTGGTGNITGTVVATPVPPCSTCPLLEDAAPCDKVNNINTKFPTMPQSLMDLATTTSQNHENGLFIDSNATTGTVNPAQTIPPNTVSGGSLDINMNPPNQYVVLAHTHDAVGKDGTGTRSIFSWDDLTTINTLIKDNHINTNNFVFYVITADGTRYALTIDNPGKLDYFFYKPTGPIGTIVDMDRLEKNQKIFETYYDTDSNGLILTTSNPVDDKANFLKFMKEANLGVSLFEVDATFTNYEKLTINNLGVVTPTPCN